MLITYDSSGEIVAVSYGVGYPSPPDVLERAQASTGEGTRVIDLPPLEPGHWLITPEGPRLKPSMDVKVVSPDSGHSRLEGLPAGAVVSVTGGAAVTTVFSELGSSVSLDLPDPGSYRVVATAPGWAAWSADVARAPGAATATDADVRVLSVAGGGAELARRVLARAPTYYAGQTAPLTLYLPLETEAKIVKAGGSSARLGQVAAAAGKSPEEYSVIVLQGVEQMWRLTSQQESLRAEMLTYADGSAPLSEVQAALDKYDLPAEQRI